VNTVLCERRNEWNFEEDLMRKFSLIFNPEYMEEHPEEINQIIFWINDEVVPRYALTRQLDAIRRFNLGDEVSRIRAPTLITAGTSDRVVSYKSSEIPAEIIPNSRLVLFEEASHFLFIEEAPLFNRTVMDFFG